jgi:hypothetical protein
MAHTNLTESGNATPTQLQRRSVDQSSKPDGVGQGQQVGNSSNQNLMPTALQPSPATPSESDLSGLQSAAAQFLTNSGGHGNPAEWNEKFESESRDPKWAPHAEAQLQDYAARHPYASAYQAQWIECRETLCQFYAEIEDSMAQAIQQAPAGSLDPFEAMQHDSIAQNLEQLGASFDADDQSKRIAMLIPFRRRSGAE